MGDMMKRGMGGGARVGNGKHVCAVYGGRKGVVKEAQRDADARDQEDEEKEEDEEDEERMRIVRCGMMADGDDDDGGRAGHMQRGGEEEVKERNERNEAKVCR